MASVLGESILGHFGLAPTGNSPEISRRLEEVVNLILANVLQKAAMNARIGHRTKINVFDITKVCQSLHVSLLELVAYIRWFQGIKRKGQVSDDTMSPLSLSHIQSCQVRLEFGNGSDLKKFGSEYFPPIPPAYTYKFTPIYGKREDDAISLLKRRAEEKQLVEKNLYNNSLTASETSFIINCDDI